MNNRGQAFSFILVFITLLMVSISIGVYIKQQQNVPSSLVSPLAVLEVRDNLTIFEMREKRLILDSLEKTSSVFGTEDFKEEFRDNIILDIDDKMRDFIFSNLVFSGQAIKRGDPNEDNFLKNIVYNENNFIWKDSSSLEFKRGEMEKWSELRALKTFKTNFAVDFNFKFDREYLITKRGGKYIVEVVE